jgi:hypothetical protein
MAAEFPHLCGAIYKHAAKEMSRHFLGEFCALPLVPSQHAYLIGSASTTGAFIATPLPRRTGFLIAAFK